MNFYIDNFKTSNFIDTEEPLSGDDDQDFLPDDHEAEELQSTDWYIISHNFLLV
jgi:hypothetical protein